MPMLIRIALCIPTTWRDIALTSHSSVSTRDLNIDELVLLLWINIPMPLFDLIHVWVDPVLILNMLRLLWRWNWYLIDNRATVINFVLRDCLGISEGLAALEGIVKTLRDIEILVKTLHVLIDMGRDIDMVSGENLMVSRVISSDQVRLLLSKLREGLIVTTDF